jgi:hypothetical protein
MTTFADLAQMGKPTGRVLVEKDGAMWINTTESDFYEREENLRRTARLCGAKFEAWLLFEKGRQRI